MNFTDIPERKTIMWKMEGDNATVNLQNKTYILNTSAALVWNLSDGINTVHDIVHKLKTEYNVENDEKDLEKIVLACLDSMIYNGIILIKSSNDIEGWFEYE